MTNDLKAFIKSQIRAEFDRKHTFIEEAQDYSLKLILWMAEIDEQEAEKMASDLRAQQFKTK